MKEIERKWKLTRAQATEFLNRNWPEKCYNIYQGYFYCDDPNKEFRVRLMTNKDDPHDDKSYLTIKDKTYNKERKELEISVRKESAFLLLNECERFLEKNRYICSDGLELNIYKGEPNFLAIIEKEFESITESEQYVPNFEYEEEVTYDPAFYNFNLCKKVKHEDRNVDKN
jgi:CYTH domain-containing protein